MKKTVLVIVLLLTALFQYPAAAQSDESDAVDSRRQGFAFQEQGDYSKALFYYLRALALQPGNAAICNDAALMQEYVGAVKEAEQGYLKAISLDRDYLPVYANLGMFYSKQGQYVLAAKYLRQRVERGRPEDPWTLQAQEELIKVCKKVPALEAERLRAQAEELDNKIVQAKDKMKRSAERNRSLDFQTAYQSGLDALTSRDFSKAVEALETAVMLNPRSNGAREALRRARFGKEKVLLESQSVVMQMDDKNRSVAKALDSYSSQ
ncbi:MAG: tetratricopeptide repeat protein [Candidatus Omnitrophica bacterium]|nr:tetratricopeptide repeat protein [Candidatus Omnitrophota bacterium]